MFNISVGKINYIAGVVNCRNRLNSLKMYGYLMAMNLSFLEGKFKAKSCECNLSKKKVSYNV